MITPRLEMILRHVGGQKCADIGTDHAYIPIYLVQNGISKRAIATDINEGPILRARQNIIENGLRDKIACYVASGLDGIEPQEPTDITICGMGGELIAKIIDASSYIRNDGVNLILQPMTSALELREYLQNGFEIYNEKVVFEDGKYYQIICARYDGKPRKYTSVELEMGKINIESGEKIFLDFLEYTILKKKKILKGLIAGNCNTEKIEAEIRELEALR